jgi:predicted ATPase
MSGPPTLPAQGQPATIIGRDHEIAHIETLLAATARASMLVIEGSAGIGKTTLLRAAAAAAAERGHRVLLFQAAEGERDFGLAALSGLLGGVVDEVLPLLPAPQARALEVARHPCRPRSGTTHRPPPLVCLLAPDQVNRSAGVGGRRL